MSINRILLKDCIFLGDSEKTLTVLPDNTVGLVFTSPPYFNARPEYSTYDEYETYLAKMGRIIKQCHRVLREGRFFVINVSPVLVKRKSRSHASQRLALPFDLHRVIVDEGFDFIDDIIWEKPEGAGWATSRGRRFAADRNPLQYKTVPVTEYLLVYRKHTDKLIDWNIREYEGTDILTDSLIPEGYERTNIWRITPTSSKQHPAVFPLELADKVVRYYSFKGDTVLDPFAGRGTTAEACINNGRGFVMSEMMEGYVETIEDNLKKWMGDEAENVPCFVV